MVYFAHSGHDHGAEHVASSNNSPVAMLVIIGVVIAVVVGTAIVMSRKSRAKKPAETENSSES